MSEFVQKSDRSGELPLGCKDLLDVEEIRNWKPAGRPNWATRTVDQLAYLEGYLSRLLESAGKSVLVVIGRYQDRGQIRVIPDADLVAPIIFASWNGAAQEQAVRGVFDEAGTPPVTERVGRWKANRTLKYLLPTDPTVAARFIGEIFRAGYGLVDRSSVSLLYHEPKAA